MGTILVKSALNALKIEVFKKKIIEEIHLSGTFYWNCAHFLSADFGILLRDMNLT